MKIYQERNYDDIINLPHHVSKKHPQMALQDRAAQFSPFAAVTGHEEAIEETARLTDERIVLDEDEKMMLDERLQEIKEHLSEHPKVGITYFKPDSVKDGGAYETVSGHVKKIDEYERLIVLEDGTRVKVDELVRLCRQDNR